MEINNSNIKVNGGKKSTAKDRDQLCQKNLEHRQILNKFLLK